MKIITPVVYLLSVYSIYTTEGWGIGSEYKFFKEQIKKHAVSFDVFSDTEKWIEQPLDHFDNHEKRTWKMKYYENLQYWKEGGPIYLIIGGEGRLIRYNAARTRASNYLDKLANETNGAMYYSEHRYYGDSIPLNESVVDNLKHLSSKQALADLSYLIRTLKSSPNFKHSKVVAVGCSYAGNLASWMRLKYPEIVDAAWASSGPVLAKKDFYEYFQTYAENLKEKWPITYEKTVKQFERYDMLLHTAEGKQQLKKEENICEEVDMADPLNKASFIMSKLTHVPCPSYMVNNVHKKSCCDYRFKRVIYKVFPWKTWFYQKCTEFGYFKTTKPPFTNYVNLDFFIKICSTHFGPEFNEKRVNKGILNTNKEYGGLTPNVTKVVYVYGDQDEWKNLGILKNLSDSAIAKVIHKQSHCSDFNSIGPDDPVEYTEIINIIKHWIGYAND